MINLLVTSGKGLIKQYIMSASYILLGLLLAPLISFLIIEFFGRHVQSSFGYAFGAHTQALFGGIGAVLHEFYELVVAFLCGHSLSMVHMHTIYNIRNGFKLDSSGHLWDTHHMWNVISNFFLGILPYYLMAFTLIGCQFILGGDPLPKDVIDLPLSTYTGISTWKTMLFDSLGNDFSVSALGFIFLIIIVIVLCLNGFYITTSENSSAFEGIIPWAIILLCTSVVATTLSYGKDLTFVSVNIMNICIWIAMKLVWYLLGVWAIVLCFSAINHTTDTAHKASNYLVTHSHHKIHKPIRHRVVKHHFNLRKQLLNKRPKMNRPRPRMQMRPRPIMPHSQPQQQMQHHQPQMRIPVQHKYVRRPNPNFKPQRHKPAKRPSMMSKLKHFKPNFNHNNHKLQLKHHPHVMNKIHRPVHSNNQVRSQKHPSMNNPHINRSQNKQYNQQPQVNNQQSHPNQQINRPISKQQNKIDNHWQNNPYLNTPNKNSGSNINTRPQPQQAPQQNKASKKNKGLRGKVRGFFVHLDNHMSK